ncbi:WASH complex subunit 2 [Coccinella septempunctata]|uniref:WASH complex subunit 2 n=1 Tax=Coccinella septempunctata TaxID=41139 RepID=UPI001D077E43|nr:WASH complex subunit 2 [Coccinella septempunctata]
MSKESGKDWERPWTTEEIVEHADDWNLACDAALLNTLKAFADKILKKAEDVNEKIEKLNENLSKIHLQVDLSRNEFSSLRNTQFVECRVYDDDETLFLEKSKDEEKKNNVPEEETVEDFREAVALGLEILDEYYDKVKVTVSDSEGEDEDEPSYVYRRKDPYINRRLPFVIGSEEWHKKWHVGLEETDSENEQSSEKLSESESEDNVSEKKDHSDVSSELSHFSGLNSSKVQPLQVPRNTQQDLQASASGSDVSAEPVPKTLSFAEQLAAKLGSVIKEKDDSLKEPEINRRPIQKQPSDYGALFSNEPPPLDDVKTQESRGIFSDGKDLFDDEDEDDLWKPGDNKIASTKTISTSDLKQAIFREPEQGKGLFDDDSDDDIFASTKNRSANQQIKQPYLQSNKPLVPVFNEEPPLFDEEPNVKEKKKPTGGVSLFGESDIFQGPAIGKILKQRRVSSSEDEDEPKLNQKEKKPSISKDITDEDALRNKNTSKQTISSVPQSAGPEKRKSLFDDDIFSDDLFTSVEKKNSTGLFEKNVLFSDDENNESFLPRAGSTSASERGIETDKPKNLQSNIVQSPDDTDYSFKKNSKSNITTLFDDLEDDNDDIFMAKEDKNIGITNTKKSERKVEEDKKVKTAGLFDDLDDEDDLFSGLSKKNDDVKTKKSTSFLFDDNEDDDFDIFQSKDNKNDSGRVKKENTTNESRNTESKVKDLADKSPKPNLSLFDDDSDDMDDLFSQISRKDAKTSENTEKTSIITESSQTSLKEKTEILKDDSPAQDETSENLRKPSTSNEPSIYSDPMENSPVTSETQNLENSMKNGDPSIKNKSETTKADDDNKGAIKKEKLDEESGHTKIPEISIVEDTKTTEKNMVAKCNESDKYKSSSGVLNVEFMDSIPPPDDDWDTYSDNAFDDMEQINDGLQSKASSLFDNEPPSLFFEDPINESLPSIKSKPQKVPSDIFNSGDKEEEQNVPNTNANNDINANSEENEFLSIPSATHEVLNEKNPSVAPTSSLENIATISSDTERLEREYSENQHLENDKNGNKIKSKPPIARRKPSTNKNIEKTESLFDDDLDVDQIDFLFPKVKSTNDKDDNSEISEDIISGDKSCKKSVSFDSSEENRIETDEPGVGSESEDDMQKNILKITEKLQQISNKQEERTKPIAVPGKLSHNLNINVGALLPGSALPKREKVQSPDQNEKLSKSLPASRFNLNEELSAKPHVPTKPITIVRGSSQEAPSTKEHRNLEKSVSFDGGTDIEVLQSITKDRPRIPVKRRPSSRRARQKSLRDSMSDFRLDDPIPDETSESDKRESVEEQKTLDVQTSVDSSDKNEKDSKNVIEIFSDIENSEDLFKSIEKEVKSVNKANIISTKSKEPKHEKEETKKLSDSLFQDDEDDLFESILTKEKHRSEISKEKEKVSHDETKSIFTDSSKEKDEEHLGKIDKEPEKKPKTIDNLFDSSDDDDIFKSTKVSIIGRTVEGGTSSKPRTEKSVPDKLFDFSDDEDFLENCTRRKEDDETKKTNVKHQNDLLFDDTDNDDIFGTNSSTKNETKQDVKPSVINKKPPKSTSLRKLENIEGVEDPLSALLK